MNSKKLIKSSFLNIAVVFFLFIFSALNAEEISVTSLSDLQKAVSKAKSGDVIVLEDGKYDDKCDISAKGTKEAPIVIRSKSPGKVEFRNQISINGDYITLIGFNFSGKGIVRIKGLGIRLSRCVMSNVQVGIWVRVDPASREIEIDHCLFENKEINKTKEKGCQLVQVRVFNKKERHHIHHNHFRNIPKGKVGNGYETLQLITHRNPKDPQGGNSETIIEDNLFEKCNGESEIISIKSNGNIIRRNTFRSCYGSLVLRHGDCNVANGNFFLGDGVGSGGVRLQGTDQVVVNNYFQDLGRSAVAMMDGTSDKLYVRVERAKILHNTIVNCKYSMEVGLNHSKHPNGTVPKDCTIANNIFYNNKGKEYKAIRFVQDDQPENWKWIGNIVFGNLGIQARTGIVIKDPKLKISKNGFLLPTGKTPSDKESDIKIKQIDTDLFGTYRKGKITAGAVQFPLPSTTVMPLTEKEVGPNSRK